LIRAGCREIDIRSVPAVRSSQPMKPDLPTRWNAARTGAASKKIKTGERVLTHCENRSPAGPSRSWILLRRFATESARKKPACSVTN